VFIFEHETNPEEDIMKFNNVKQAREFLETQYIDPSDYFDELESLRDSGEINMFGAPSWMVENIDLTINCANAVFLVWTEDREVAA
jgi:hypothetical protein